MCHQYFLGSSEELWHLFYRTPLNISLQPELFSLHDYMISLLSASGTRCLRYFNRETAWEKKLRLGEKNTVGISSILFQKKKKRKKPEQIFTYKQNTPVSKESKSNYNNFFSNNTQKDWELLSRPCNPVQSHLHQTILKKYILHF